MKKMMKKGAKAMGKKMAKKEATGDKPNKGRGALMRRLADKPM